MSQLPEIVLTFCPCVGVHINSFVMKAHSGSDKEY
jgi:hypothetical protein